MRLPVFHSFYGLQIPGFLRILKKKCSILDSLLLASKFQGNEVLRVLCVVFIQNHELKYPNSLQSGPRSPDHNCVQSFRGLNPKPHLLDYLY